MSNETNPYTNREAIIAKAAIDFDQSFFIVWFRFFLVNEQPAIGTEEKTVGITFHYADEDLADFLYMVNDTLGLCKFHAVSGSPCTCILDEEGRVIGFGKANPGVEGLERKFLVWPKAVDTLMFDMPDYL